MNTLILLNIRSSSEINNVAVNPNVTSGIDDVIFNKNISLVSSISSFIIVTSKHATSTEAIMLSGNITVLVAGVKSSNPVEGGRKHDS